MGEEEEGRIGGGEEMGEEGNGIMVIGFHDMSLSV